MKKSFTVAIFISGLIMFSGCSESKPQQETITETQKNILIDIKTISNKSISDIESILGKAEDTESAKPSGTICENTSCKKAYFQNGKYEILFIKNLSDWITINSNPNTSLDENSITLLGLPKTKPTFTSTNVMRWENIEGIKEINFFNNGNDQIDYIYIKSNSL